ncbi:EAL domain-containing response regulator [Sulfurimonas sp.]
MKLLYIEDNELVRNSTMQIFNDLFLEITPAINGEDGLEKFYDSEIDIIISDINMPRLNGLEMVETLRKFDSDIPILLLSAHSEINYFTKSIQLNIDGYMLKPLQIDDLLESLGKIVQKIKFQEEYNNNLIFLKQYQELTDSNTSVSKTNPKGTITYVNNEFCKISGYTQEELIGNKHNIIRHPDNPTSMYIDMWHAIKHEKKPWKGVIRNLSKDGEIFYANTMIRPILDNNDNVVEYIALKTNVTDVMSPKKQLYDFVDSAFEPMVLLIRIEGFADIEKFYGHNISQEIDDNFAKDLKSHMPENLNFGKCFSLSDGEYSFAKDLGKEFRNYTKYESDIYMTEIIDELRNFQYTINELNIDVGDFNYDISIIISIANGIDCLENVKYGMKALQRNKQDFIIANNFAKQEQEEAQNNLKILKMVKKAIETSNIISFFQPIVCNKTKKIMKYESLVRLVDEDEKVISPYFFLDIAKKGKYYAQITSMVLENSFKALEKTDKNITINISALDIEKSITRKKIYELLELHKDSSDRVVFELLEDEDVKDFDEIEKFIYKVKMYGVKIAIDDFGAGYSNFERLLKYQPDILKIDGSLIKNIETDSYSLSVVKTIVSFAKEQNIEMVAEFIENENIYHILKDLGVEYSQGYYFGKPDLMD